MAKKCHKTILLHLLWKWWPLFLNSWSECQASWATKELSWVHVRIRSSNESRVWIIKCSYSPTSQVWGIPTRHPRAIYLYTDNIHITNDILHNLGEAPPTPAFWWAATEYKLLYYHAYFMLSLPFVFPERNRVTKAVHCHNSVEWYGHRATPALLPCNWELVPHAWPARDKWPGRAGALALCHQGSYSYVIQKPSTCTVAETSPYPLL